MVISIHEEVSIIIRDALPAVGNKDVNSLVPLIVLILSTIQFKAQQCRHPAFAVEIGGEIVKMN